METEPFPSGERGPGQTLAAPFRDLPREGLADSHIFPRASDGRTAMVPGCGWRRSPIRLPSRRHRPIEMIPVPIVLGSPRSIH
jgi:hypothetical protein